MRRFVLRNDDASPETEIGYAAELNAQQHAAATAKGGAVLVVAGAGTGKTRTLIYRVAYLVETGTPPESIVLLTFTRRAARQMLGRASTLLDGRCRRVQGGTFHSFCLQLLRRHADRAGLPRGFTVLDQQDAAEVAGVVRAQSGLAEGEKRFPKKDLLQRLFSASQNRQLTLQDLVEEDYPHLGDFLPALQQLQRAFAAYKLEHALVDFDDLLLLTERLLRTDDEVRQQVGRRCRHVLVDEYQDTNALQARLVEHFASVHGNVMAVGDDAQSIYRFRGADVENILRFPERFENARVLKLEENYRSTQPVLDFANAVLKQARKKYDKELFSHEQEGDPPWLVTARDGRQEAQFVGQVILQQREAGVPLSRMAVLFRSSYRAFDVEAELNRRGIPYVKYGGLKLTESAHVKDVLAHLRVLENPLDVASWNRALQLLPGIGPKTSFKLIDWLTERARLEGEGDEDVQLLRVDEDVVSGRYADALRHLFATLRHLKMVPKTPLPAQLEAIVDYYEPFLKDRYAEDHPKRAQDLEHLIGLAEGFASREELLATLTLDPADLSELEAAPDDDPDDEPPLVLSTIHSAKGLEFDTVFLIQTQDGSLPSRRALGDPADEDEELRLLYVASTRAERHLFLSYPSMSYQRSTGDFWTQPSRFLVDLPEGLLEPAALVEEGAEEEREAEELPAQESSAVLPPSSGDGAASEEGDLPF